MFNIKAVNIKLSASRAYGNNRYITLVVLVDFQRQ